MPVGTWKSVGGSKGRPRSWRVQDPERIDVISLTGTKRYHQPDYLVVVYGDRKVGEGCVDSPEWDPETGLFHTSYSLGYQDLLDAAAKYPLPGAYSAIQIICEAALDQDGDNPCWERIDHLYWEY